MTRETLKLALEALEECRRDPRLKYEHPAYDKTITAIKEALAQPEQEPVIGTKTWFEDGKLVTQHLHPSDIYTTPPQRKPLTDEQIEMMWQGYCKQWKTSERIVINFVDFARAIETAHSIKE